LCATSNPFFKISCIHDGCIHLIQTCISVVSCRKESTIFHVQKFCVLLAYNPYFKFIYLHDSSLQIICFLQEIEYTPHPKTLCTIWFKFWLIK
jgi:hypothetical protein